MARDDSETEPLASGHVARRLPAEAEQDLSEVDAQVEAETRNEPDIDAPPPPDDDPPP